MGKKLFVPPDAVLSETDKIERYLRSQVIDQDRAIREITRSINRGEAGLQNPDHPLGVFLFLGPTGVGKTHTALELAKVFQKKLWRCQKFEECGYETTFKKGKELNYQPTTLVVCPEHHKDGKNIPLEEVEIPEIWRVDCGQLSDHKGPLVHYLMGAPVGYIGNDQTPFFHGKAPKVVLFDEIEKAIVPNNWWEEKNGLEDILLKIIQNGRILNQKKEEVDFTESFIIMTGNLGTREVTAEIGKNSVGFLASQNPVKKVSQMGDEEIEKLNERIYRIIKEKFLKEFPPEFVNRIDRLVVFRFLKQSSYQKIFDREAAKIQARIDKSPTPFRLEFKSDAKMFFVDEAFSDRQYGANPLGRLLEKNLVSEIANLINHKVIRTDSVVQVGLEKGELVFLEKNEKKTTAIQEGGR